MKSDDLKKVCFLSSVYITCKGSLFFCLFFFLIEIREMFVYRWEGGVGVYFFFFGVGGG